MWIRWNQSGKSDRDQILILNIWWEQLMIYHMKTTPEPCAI